MDWTASSEMLLHLDPGRLDYVQLQILWHIAKQCSSVLEATDADMNGECLHCGAVQLHRV